MDKNGNKDDQRVLDYFDGKRKDVYLGYFKVAQTNSNMIFVRNECKRKVMEVVG